MGRRGDEDSDYGSSNEPDFEGIVERRAEYRMPREQERAERSYERYVTGD